MIGFLSHIYLSKIYQFLKRASPIDRYPDDAIPRSFDLSVLFFFFFLSKVEDACEFDITRGFVMSSAVDRIEERL